MGKRFIGSLLILGILINGIMLGEVAYASENAEVMEISQDDSINAAKLIAATFVVEDIKNNAESGWNQPMFSPKSSIISL